MKLTVQNTGLQLVDANPVDPFDFLPDHYYDQPVAGYSKNLPDQGLLTVAPDYYRLYDGFLEVRHSTPDLTETSVLHKE